MMNKGLKSVLLPMIVWQFPTSITSNSEMPSIQIRNNHLLFHWTKLCLCFVSKLDIYDKYKKAFSLLDLLNRNLPIYVKEWKYLYLEWRKWLLAHDCCIFKKCRHIYVDKNKKERNVHVTCN